MSILNNKKTKEEISREFHICIRTVRRTMQAAQISTLPKTHSAEEIEQFVIARRLIKQGRSYREVAEYFNQRNNQKEVSVNA